jgi:ABC-type uncharacterized transport system ATPase component
MCPVTHTTHDEPSENAVMRSVELTKIFASGATDAVAFRNVSISAERGEFVTIVGSYGAEKLDSIVIVGGKESQTFLHP